MRIHEKWPSGHGVDLEFWNKQKLWHLCDAAAISLGVDPRVTYSDEGTRDRILHGGPKLAENEIPGLITEIENLVVMAQNGLLPVLKNGLEDVDDKAFWYIRPTDFWTLMKEELADTNTSAPIWDPEADGRAVKERYAKAPLGPENQRRDLLAFLLKREGFTHSQIVNVLEPGLKKHPGTVKTWINSGELILARLHENKNKK